MEKLSDKIRDAFVGGAEQQTVGDVLASAAREGFGLLLVVVSIPVAIPVTPPGLSIPFGIMVIVLVAQLYAGRTEPWFPAWIKRKPIKAKEDSKFVRFMVRFTRFFERFTVERWPSIFGRGSFRAFVLPVMLFCGIAMLVPLPGASWLPSTGVFLVGMGMIERDGRFAAWGTGIGLIGSIITIGIVVAAVIYGPQAVVDWMDGLKPSVGASG